MFIAADSGQPGGKTSGKTDVCSDGGGSSEEAASVVVDPCPDQRLHAVDPLSETSSLARVENVLQWCRESALLYDELRDVMDR